MVTYVPSKWGTKHPTEVFIHLVNLSSFNILQKENKYLPLQESCLSCRELKLNYLGYEGLSANSSSCTAVFSRIPIFSISMQCLVQFLRKTLWFVIVNKKILSSIFRSFFWTCFVRGKGIHIHGGRYLLRI